MLVCQLKLTFSQIRTPFKQCFYIYEYGRIIQHLKKGNAGREMREAIFKACNYREFWVYQIRNSGEKSDKLTRYPYHNYKCSFEHCD